MEMRLMGCRRLSEEDTSFSLSMMNARFLSPGLSSSNHPVLAFNGNKTGLAYAYVAVGLFSCPP